MKYIGIDIGGMSIKAGIVESDGTIVAKKTIETDVSSEQKTVADIAELIKSILFENNLSLDDVAGVGIGSPGSVYDEKGIIRYSCNLNFKNTPLVRMLQQSTGIRNIKVSNDANCAALGETLFGAGKGAKNTVMITLGTGVGTGIVVDGKLLTGNHSAGAEGGHITINFGGATCGCGKKGHLEAYASATALMNQVRVAIEKHPESLLAKRAAQEGVHGKLVFDCRDEGDKVAERVVKRYLRYVGIGLVNYANIFYPEVIIIGGGISNQGDKIEKPLQRYVSRNVYGAQFNPHIKVACATLKNDAGIVGAACLVM